MHLARCKNTGFTDIVLGLNLSEVSVVTKREKKDIGSNQTYAEHRVKLIYRTPIAVGSIPQFQKLILNCAYFHQIYLPNEQNN